MRSGTRGALAVSIVLILVWRLVLVYYRHGDASTGAATFNIYCSKCHVPDSREALGSDLRHIMAPGHLRESDVRKIIIDGKDPAQPGGRNQTAGGREFLSPPQGSIDIWHTPRVRCAHPGLISVVPPGLGFAPVVHREAACMIVGAVVRKSAPAGAGRV